MKPLPQLAILAVIGETVLLASAWLLPMASEYRLVGDNISELALGRYGFIQTVAFVISGLAVIGLAYVIGLMQRLMITAVSGWLILVALRAFSIA